MIPAWDYSQVRRDLKRAFEYRYEKNGFGGVRMVGLLFAPPEARLAREEIIPGLRYFHYRSGDNIDFFCAGYRRYGPDLEPGEKAVTDDEPPWVFNLWMYEQFRRQIQQLSSWRYSGEADLLLMNANFDEGSRDSSLDFTSAIACDLDRMMKDGAILSVRRFFEDIFQFAETAQMADPTWGFSDEQGLRTAGSALKRVVLSVLPKHLGDDYRRAEHFAIRDISAAS
ncbi:MAG: hypothetical protein WAM70_01270 [Pyrinomonadaceae bacterium]